MAAEVTVESRRLKLSNPDKVLYPAVGFTKAQVIDYYTRIAPVLLPHLQGRIVTLKRYPDGVEGEFFYEKMCPAHRPRWVHTASVWTASRGRYTHYCVIDDLPTLVWVANLASLELHTALARVEDMERPTTLVLDLDPGPPADLLDCAEVGLWLRQTCAPLGLESFPKVSGKKGLHIHVPLNGATTYEQTKSVARALAERLAGEHPDRVVSNIRRSLREGRVFIDWSQNADPKTTVCVYSLRASQRPTVSAPVSWDEVETALRHRDAARLVFDSDQVLERVQRLGDLYAPVLDLAQSLPDVAAIKAA